MSANKYANLPDIDTAPDVYETEDVFPSAHDEGADSSDDEPSAVRARAKAAANGGTTTTGVTAGTATNPDELDESSLIAPQDASKRFHKAERARRHARTRFAYPPSPGSSDDDDAAGSRDDHDGSRRRTRARTLPARLRALQAELTALEAELADPSNPALRDGGDGDEGGGGGGDGGEGGKEGGKEERSGVDQGEMIRGVVDVRRRLEKVRRGREGRGRLVGVVVGEGGQGGTREESEESEEEDEEEDDDDDDDDEQDKGAAIKTRTIVEMDRRVGELEKLVGSVSATLDETTPLTPPLLPMLMRLHNQLTLLTQPRHIDSVSRRLKLLLSDLDRVSASQAQKRQQQQATGGPMLTPAQDAVLPLLSRLAPFLPHIPHILTRLRTLSALHASATEFQDTITALEEEQRRTRDALDALNTAVTNVEASLEANRATVAGNVSSLEDRVEKVSTRLEEVAK